MSDGIEDPVALISNRAQHLIHANMTVLGVHVVHSDSVAILGVVFEYLRRPNIILRLMHRGGTCTKVAGPGCEGPWLCDGGPKFFCVILELVSVPLVYFLLWESTLSIRTL
jgi:hypothetical protein